MPANPGAYRVLADDLDDLWVKLTTGSWMIRGLKSSVHSAELGRNVRDECVHRGRFGAL